MCSLAIVEVKGVAGAQERRMRQLWPANDCSGGSARVRLEYRPDAVQDLTGNLLDPIDLSPSQRSA